jgi:outer membrane protein TolC
LFRVKDLSAINRLPLKDAVAVIVVIFASILGPGLLPETAAQMQNSGPSHSQASGGAGMTSQSPGASPNSVSSQNPFMGSAPEGTATTQVLSLTFKDAIDRGLRNNLGLLLENDNTLAARGQRWQELSALLPNVNAEVGENVAKINLAAEGFRFSGPAFAGIPTIVGPFGFFDARVNWSQPLFDLNAWDRERGATENVKAAQANDKNARDLVVLAVGNSYLEALSGEARVETAQAQLATAQTLYENSVDQENAGVIPQIDRLRAQVEMQSRQQQLIAARNDFAKEKLTLARVIGLPPGQKFTLAEKEPYAPLATISVNDALRRAYAGRADYQAAQRQVFAAQYFDRAAKAEHYPTLEIGGNFGDTSVAPGDPAFVYQAAATLKIPLFTGNKSHADQLQALAELKQSEQRLADLRGQIDYEVRTALLDLQSASDQVKVAQSEVQLADQTLSQARDRFAAGVTNNLEVVQAQESVASANESYIEALYAHNLAKVELARAMGYAEEGVKLYLQGHNP